MRKPAAQSMPAKAEPQAETLRAPRAFAPDEVTRDAALPEAWHEPDLPVVAAPPQPRKNWWLRLALSAGGLLVSLGLGLAAERLISDLFARFDWLGWVGMGLAGLLVVGILGLIIREVLALRRLSNLEHLRDKAALIHLGGSRDDGRTLIGQLQTLYQDRPDLAQARRSLDRDLSGQFDGTEMLSSTERQLMAPLDARAKALTTAASRRVALVTAVSPRALVDILFVAYESLKLTRAIAHLYGSRPGLFSGWKLAGEVLGHLAVTGGVALGDSVIQQLLGQGLAARLSARLGEGLVNGLMTARVGIAAMQVTRPLPFHALKQPNVMEFAVDLGKVARKQAETD